MLFRAGKLKKLTAACSCTAWVAACGNHLAQALQIPQQYAPQAAQL